MTETTTSFDVCEVRRRPRFHLKCRMTATFSGLPATITDVSAEGIGLQHATPIRINSAGAIRIESEENVRGVTFRGRVRWSRLSRTANHEGKYLYSSGVEIEETSDAASGLLGRLIRAFGERDTNSMQLKKKAAAERAQARSLSPALLPRTESVPRIAPDQALLIKEARVALENHPESAQEWYNRAKYSLVKRELIADIGRSIPYRREVIVIWEYLGGAIDLDVITSVIELDKTRPRPSAPIER